MEHTITRQLEKEYKESFFQTPLWYLGEGFNWLKEKSTFSIKKELYNPNLPFGVGKIIELSLYPQSSSIYRLDTGEEKPNIEHVSGLYDPEITELEVDKSFIYLYLKDTVSPSPEILENHLKTFLCFLLFYKGDCWILKSLDMEDLEIKEISENLNYENGLLIEALTH